MILNKFKLLGVSLLSLLLVGCAASLYDLPDTLVAVEKYKMFDDPKLGFSFQYPDYFGSPQLSFYDGKQGNGFLLIFSYGDNLDDPFTLYVAGTSADFVSLNPYERTYYNGGFDFLTFCSEKEKNLGFVQKFGKNCNRLNFGEKSVIELNAAFLDAISNSVERVFLLNYPVLDSSGNYSGLQIGFKIPQRYLQFSRFDTIDNRAEKALERLLGNLDQSKVSIDLAIELERAKRMVESVEFLSQS